MARLEAAVDEEVLRLMPRKSVQQGSAKLLCRSCRARHSLSARELAARIGDSCWLCGRALRTTAWAVLLTSADLLLMEVRDAVLETNGR